MSKSVRVQKTRIIQSAKDASKTENSQYWDDFHQKTYGTLDDGERVEHPQANPDVLPEMDHSPSNPQLIMGEAIEHLQGRQKEVYLLAMREGKSESEIGEILGIARQNAHVYKVRAIKFIELYCKEAIARGRV